MTPPPAAQKIPLRAWLLLLLLTLAWGSMWPFLKIALAEIPLMSLRASSASLGGVVLLFAAFLTGRRIRPAAGESGKIVLTAVFTTLCWFYLSGLAVTLLPAGRAALLAYTMPFFSLLISIFFLKERVTRKRYIGVFAGVAAIFVLSWDDVMRAGADGFPLGIVAILLAAVTWSIGSTMQKNYMFQTPVSVLTGWMLVVGGIPLCIIASGTDSLAWIGTVSPQALFAAVSIAIFSTALGMLCWSGILKLTDIGFASIAVLSVPVMSQILSFILLGESFDLTKGIGLALILFGLSTILPLNGLMQRLTR